MRYDHPLDNGLKRYCTDSETVEQSAVTLLECRGWTSGVHYHRLDFGDNKQVTGKESDVDADSSLLFSGRETQFP
ncbi:mCG66400 [Mus musculus]|nr:mCG66400 [Mus musculus]